jgi:hypothetical protein
MKSFLQKRVTQLEEEINSLRSFLIVVDSLLAERSFRPVQIHTTQPTPPAQPASSDTVPVMSTDGVRIASITVRSGSLEIILESDAPLDANSPPLRAFFVGKVLEGMQAKDKEAAVAGTIQPDAILTYSVEQEGGKLKAIHIQNYGDERRLLELKNAIRWTFRRMYEKATGTKST